MRLALVSVEVVDLSVELIRVLLSDAEIDVLSCEVDVVDDGELAAMP